MTAATPASLAAWLAPGRTALLVIDVQVDFASPDGKMGQWGLDFSAVPGAIAATNALIDAARGCGVPVIFVALVTSPDSDSPSWKERMRRMGEDAGESYGVCRAGTEGAAFYGVAPLGGEAVVEKTKYSGFYGTDLDARLKSLGVDTLVMCGLTTECCVDCTARDAFHLDYHVFLPTDASAAYGDDVHQAALKSLVLNCVIPTRTNDVVSAWNGAKRAYG